MFTFLHLCVYCGGLVVSGKEENVGGCALARLAGQEEGEVLWKYLHPVGQFDQAYCTIIWTLSNDCT